MPSPKASSRLMPTTTSALKGWIPTVSEDPNLFDPLTTTVQDLRKGLSNGLYGSTQILQQYYYWINKHNGYLRGIYELSPHALSRAKHMDSLRKEGQILGVFHGIPILLKDNIAVHPSLGMGTTAGALALQGSKPKSNAAIVDLLLKSGAILFAKATLSEYSYFKDPLIRCGWSALAGQGQNPYVKGGQNYEDGWGGHSSPGGSSSGCGISLAAGFAPLAVGTETEGSLVSPSTRQSLYTVKPTRGMVPGDGIVPVTVRYDTAGPMAKNVRDIADFLTAVVDPSKGRVPEGGYTTVVGDKSSWKDIKIGTLDPDKWHYDEALVKEVPEATNQMRALTHEAYNEIEKLAKVYHGDISLRLDKDFNYEGENSLYTMMIADYESSMKEYLDGLETSSVRTLTELRDFNKGHAEDAFSEEYPNQGHIEKALNFNRTPEEIEKILAHSQAIGASFDETIKKYDIDVIIGPGDSWLSKYSCALGLPLAAMPLSYLDYNGRPVGLMAAAPLFKEDTLLKLMGAFEATFPARKPPTAFLDLHE